jgi:hypothetical protein
MIELRSDRAGWDLLEGNPPSVIVETNFELVEHSHATEKIESNTQALRENRLVQ